MNEERNGSGYVYLSDIFYKKPDNIPQRSLKRIFKNYDSESEELDNEVRGWIREMISLPKNEWVAPMDIDAFVKVVWDRTGGARGYSSAPALQFKNYESAEQCAYLLSSYGSKETGWGNVRNWIGREYP